MAEAFVESPRTDLALEAFQHAAGTARRIAGALSQEERHGEVVISRVYVQTDEAAQALGKPKGTYVTIEARGLRRRNETLHEQVARLLAAELKRLLPNTGEAQVFVVGLGNRQATPDALGPKVVDQLLVTRHLPDYVPEDMRGGLGSLCALAPGVLGITGIETVEIIEGIVNRIRPDVVVAVDALAARNIERILTTIQIADSGLNPGAGVGNRHRAINQETLGIPVVAIGIPTVVHAYTIAMDALDHLIQRLRASDPFYSYLDRLGGTEKHRMAQEVLSPYVGDLMVTPKEVDMVVEDLSRVIAGGINAAVHRRVAERPNLL